MKSRPVVVVLAAGPGSRFLAGGNKLAQNVAGSTVLGHTLRHAVASHMNLVVVVTPALEAEARHYVAPRDVVVLPEVGSDRRQPLSMGFSIASGVSARPDASGWVILPADMPLVRPSTLVAVAREIIQHPVAYAQYQGRQVYPVGFAGELYSELVTLTGEQGAKRLLARYPAHAVEVDDAGVLVDIDTEQDLLALRKKEASPSLTPANTGT